MPGLDSGGNIVLLVYNEDGTLSQNVWGGQGAYLSAPSGFKFDYTKTTSSFTLNERWIGGGGSQIFLSAQSNGGNAALIAFNDYNGQWSTWGNSSGAPLTITLPSGISLSGGSIFWDNTNNNNATVVLVAGKNSSGSYLYEYYAYDGSGTVGGNQNTSFGTSGKITAPSGYTFTGGSGTYWLSTSTSSISINLFTAQTSTGDVTSMI